MEIQSPYSWAVVLLVLMTCTVSLGDHIPREENEIRIPEYKSDAASTRPPYYEKTKRARYMVHKATWGLVTTISSKPDILGRAFPAPESLADGPVGNSSGTPYFYLAAIDSVMADIAKQPNVTLGFTEAAFSDVGDCRITKSSDPESPLCARLMLFGKLVHVTDSKELAFAKSALFSRHPLMPTWPSGHDFRFIKLNIEYIWFLDYFGGGSSLAISDYYAAKP